MKKYMLLQPLLSFISLSRDLGIINNELVIFGIHNSIFSLLVSYLSLDI